MAQNPAFGKDEATTIVLALVMLENSQLRAARAQHSPIVKDALINEANKTAKLKNEIQAGRLGVQP